MKEFKTFLRNNSIYFRDRRINFYKIDQKYIFNCELRSDKWLEKEISFINSSTMEEGKSLSINIDYLLDSLEDSGDITTFYSSGFGAYVLCRYHREKDLILDLVMPMNNPDNMRFLAIEERNKQTEDLENISGDTATVPTKRMKKEEV